MFLKRGVHVDVRSAGEQMTPLQYVAARGDTEIGLFLIEHGAATDLGGEDGTPGRSLVDIAGTNGNLGALNASNRRTRSCDLIFAGFLSTQESTAAGQRGDTRLPSLLLPPPEPTPKPPRQGPWSWHG